MGGGGGGTGMAEAGLVSLFWGASSGFSWTSTIGGAGAALLAVSSGLMTPIRWGKRGLSERGGSKMSGAWLESEEVDLRVSVRGGRGGAGLFGLGREMFELAAILDVMTEGSPTAREGDCVRDLGEADVGADIAACPEVGSMGGVKEGRSSLVVEKLLLLACAAALMASTSPLRLTGTGLGTCSLFGAS